jgi:putative copper export protein
MTIDGTIRFFHLLAAGIWVGGLFVLGSIAANLRRAGANPDLMRSMARGYGRLAWPSLVISVVTGFWQADRLGTDMGRPAVAVKLLLVLVVVILAAFHQVTARGSSPAVRGALQGAILMVSIAILALAVAT